MRTGLFQGLLLTALLSIAGGCGDAFVATGGGGGGTTSSASGGVGGGGAAPGGSAGAGGQTTTTGPACDVVKDDACNKCLVASCADPYCTCVGDPDCIDMATCADAAQTESELEACWKDHKDSISTVGQLQACGAAACPECGLPPVGECLACEYKQCSMQTDACLSKPECVALSKCLKLCVGKPDIESCRAICLSENPDGVQGIQALTDCVGLHCAAACAPK